MQVTELSLLQLLESKLLPPIVPFNVKDCTTKVATSPPPPPIQLPNTVTDTAAVPGGMFTVTRLLGFGASNERHFVWVPKEEENSGVDTATPRSLPTPTEVLDFSDEFESQTDTAENDPPKRLPALLPPLATPSPRAASVILVAAVRGSFEAEMGRARLTDRSKETTAEILPFSNRAEIVTGLEGRSPGLTRSAKQLLDCQLVDPHAERPSVDWRVERKLGPEQDRPKTVTLVAPVPAAMFVRKTALAVIASILKRRCPEPVWIPTETVASR